MLSQHVIMFTQLFELFGLLLESSTTFQPVGVSFTQPWNMKVMSLKWTPDRPDLDTGEPYLHWRTWQLLANLLQRLTNQTPELLSRVKTSVGRSGLGSVSSQLNITSLNILSLNSLRHWLIWSRDKYTGSWLVGSCDPVSFNSGKVTN